MLCVYSHLIIFHKLYGFGVSLFVRLFCPFLFCDHLDGEERENWLLCLVPGVS